MKVILVFGIYFFLTCNLCAQWIQQNSNSSQPIHEIMFKNSNNGLAVGGGGTVFKTNDSGKTWINTNIGFTDWLYSISLPNDTIGYLTGMGGLVYKTTDFGENWSRLFTGFEGNFFKKIFFINPNIGWIAGDVGIILKTTDGGENWIQQQINTQNFLEDIQFVDKLHGWTISKWHVFRTVNGGNEWIEITNPTNYYKYSICFIDSFTGWLAGGGERIYKTIDGGDTWLLQHEGPQYLNDIYFVSFTHGWAVGRHYYTGGWRGEIIYTTDGGDTWMNQESGITADLYAIHFINELEGWAVGDSGMILASSNGGVASIKNDFNNELPTTIRLNQNYPNPFNPTTTIKYQIPEISFITIKVYDVLGNEIVTLINEEKPAGSYEVEFSVGQNNILSLSSGVYFYTLSAGSFRETKKMILMK